MIVEIILLILAILAVIVVYRTLKDFTPLLINSIGALLVLWALNFIGLKIAVDIWSILIVAIGGFAGLLLVVLLHLLGIAF